jgi:hypothetical protein
LDDVARGCALTRYGASYRGSRLQTTRQVNRRSTLSSTCLWTDGESLLVTDADVYGAATMGSASW